MTKGKEEKSHGEVESSQEGQEKDKHSEELESVLKGLPREKQDEILQYLIGFTYSQSSTYIGPIPPPDFLKGYNEEVDEGAERLMVMAEEQTAHRLDLEKYQVQETIKQGGRGQIFGFVISLVAIGSTLVLGLVGQVLAASIFGAASIGAILAAFLAGRKKLYEQQLQEDDS